MEEDRWLSVEEIAGHLGVSKETIYRWLDKGKIPTHRIGRLWKFKKSEVDRWVVEGGPALPQPNYSPRSNRNSRPSSGDMTK